MPRSIAQISAALRRLTPILAYMPRARWQPGSTRPSTEPNAIVAPTHEKAMPVIVAPTDWHYWLEGTKDEALALIRPYDGAMFEQRATPLGEAAIGSWSR